MELISGLISCKKMMLIGSGIWFAPPHSLNPRFPMVRLCRLLIFVAGKVAVPVVDRVIVAWFKV